MSLTNIILFDGLCNLCNGSVNFILKRDKIGKFKFASLQSEIGKKLLKQYTTDTNVVDSIILIKNDKVFIKSSAVLEVLKDMPVGWWVFRVGIILPRVIRDYIYDVVAKYRYRIFGKKDECPIPSKDIQDRFLG
ncbi:MAG: thiol-disulfide oxidoreductase DCC family protein [Candidatus Marinimicrobia bacterium]|nr:thiol-disulfide oxidoreductase DCC family protein [Candidatus Neomarinimicrobiota bacterium]